MAWTAPKTWAAGEALSVADFNTHIRDNLNALKTPPTDTLEDEQATDLTTVSTTFVDITNHSLTIVTTGGDILVGARLTLYANGGAIRLNILLDGVAIYPTAADGIAYVLSTQVETVTLNELLTGVDAGSHTIKLQWRISAGTASLYRAAGTAGVDIMPQFWAREI